MEKMFSISSATRVFIACSGVLLSLSVLADAITSPAGSSVSGTAAQFSWSIPVSATDLRFRVGPADGRLGSIYDSEEEPGFNDSTRTVMINGLPNDDSQVRVRLDWLDDGMQREVKVYINEESGDDDTGGEVEPAAVTLGDLDCDLNEIAKWDGTQWKCAEDVSASFPNPLEIIAALDSLCEADEEVRNINGTLKCSADCPALSIDIRTDHIPNMTKVSDNFYHCELNYQNQPDENFIVMVPEWEDDGDNDDINYQADVDVYMNWNIETGAGEALSGYTKIQDNTAISACMTLLGCDNFDSNFYDEIDDN